MLIGVISDTHGDLAAIRRAVMATGPVDMWLHGGDYSQDSDFLAEITGLPVTAVRGNCDGLVSANIDEYITASSIKIWLTHGERYQPKERVKELAWWGAKYGVRVVIYGHSHVPDNTWVDGILIFNPGSPSRPRGGSTASCGILEIHGDGLLTARLVEVSREANIDKV